jgi:hypothetical protein
MAAGIDPGACQEQHQSQLAGDVAGGLRDVQPQRADAPEVTDQQAGQECPARAAQAQLDARLPA